MKKEIIMQKKVDENYFETPQLYAESSKGDIKQWQGTARNVGDFTIIDYEFGLKGGRIQRQTQQMTEGKNIGRSNETTHFEQAVKVIQSKENKKRDKGYTHDIDNIETPILPMLALPFEKRKHNINYPCSIQPKLDGVRMTCRMTKDNTIEMFTRKGKTFTVMPHLIKELENVLSDSHGGQDTFYLDGELYSDSLTFQELAGTVRREKNDEDILKQIYYVVFDCFDTDHMGLTFHERWNMISWLGAYNDNRKYVKILQNGKAMSAFEEKEVYEHCGKLVENGYEGAIVRNLNGLYKLNHRSADLQKLKFFQDDEYHVIGFKEGSNTDKGCVIWVCETKNGKIFNVRPKGTVAQRQTWYENGKSFVGKALTVRFQELTDEGIPRFPVGIAIRDYE